MSEEEAETSGARVRLRSIATYTGAIILVLGLAATVAFWGANFNRGRKTDRIAKELKGYSVTRSQIEHFQRLGIDDNRIKYFLGKFTNPETLEMLVNEVGPENQDALFYDLFLHNEVDKKSLNFLFDGREYKIWNKAGFSFDDYVDNRLLSGFNLATARQLKEVGLVGIPEHFRSNHLPASEVQKVLKGQSLAQVTEAYAQQFGVTAEERSEYRRQGISDKDMSSLKKAGFDPEFVDQQDLTNYQRTNNFVKSVQKGLTAVEFSHWEVIQKVSVEDIFYAAENDLSRKAYEPWQADGFTVQQAVFCKIRDYSLQEATAWKAAGYTPKQMHEAKVKQRLLNSKFEEN